MTRWIASVIVLAAACGGDDNNSPDAPPTPDSSPTVDSAPAVDARPPDAAPVAREGIVIVAEQTDAEGTLDSVVGVTLNDGPLFGAPTGSASGCNFYLGPQDEGLSAGVISVTGTTVPVTVTPDGVTPPVSYDDGSPPVNLFAAGATISISAAGEAAGVPAFSGVVTAPDPLANLVLPTAISRAAPPTVTWTAGTSGEIWLWVLAFGSSDAHILWCRTTDDGTFTFPTDAVALIPNADTQGLVVLWRTNANTISAGDMTVALTAADAHSTDTLAIGP